MGFVLPAGMAQKLRCALPGASGPETHDVMCPILVVLVLVIWLRQCLPDFSAVIIFFLSSKSIVRSYFATM